MIIDRFYYKAYNFVKRYQLKSLLGGKQRGFNSTLELAYVAKSIGFYFQKIDLLVDVGAHKGLFSNAFNTCIETKKTICVEPNRQLKEFIIKNNKGYNVEVLQMGLAEKEGEFSYYLHEDDTMNSIVAANTEVLSEKFPYDDPSKLRTETIQVTTLEIALKDKIKSTDTVFLKLDTQGNELDILKGAGGILNNIQGCLIEHMFVAAYKSSYSFLDLIKYMDENGFELRGVPAIIKRHTQELSSADLLFIKK